MKSLLPLSFLLFFAFSLFSQEVEERAPLQIHSIRLDGHVFPGRLYSPYHRPKNQWPIGRIAPNLVLARNGSDRWVEIRILALSLNSDRQINDTMTIPDFPNPVLAGSLGTFHTDINAAMGFGISRIYKKTKIGRPVVYYHAYGQYSRFNFTPQPNSTVDGKSYKGDTKSIGLGAKGGLRVFETRRFFAEIAVEAQIVFGLHFREVIGSPLLPNEIYDVDISGSLPVIQVGYKFRD